MDLPESLNCRAFGSDLIFCVSFAARTIPYIMPSPGSIIPVITLPRYGCDKTVMFKVPVLDSFGTELAGIAMKIKYTIRAIDFISSKTGSLSQITDSKSLSLGASIDPAKIMSKESFGTYSAEYVQSLQKALVFHVELGKKYLLNELLFNLLEEYSERILGAEFEHEGKIYKVDNNNINRLFGIWMNGIDRMLNNHFENLELRLGNYKESFYSPKIEKR